MPRANNQYPFESRIFDWASGISGKMTGETRGFVMVLSPDGAVRDIHFGEQEERLPPNARTLMERNASWFVYDPFEGPVYTYIQWQNVQQPTMERLLGEPFTAADFDPYPALLERRPDTESLEAFPVSWGVMF